MSILVIGRGMPDEHDRTLGIFELDQAMALADQGAEVIYFGIDTRSLRWKRKLGMTSGMCGRVRWYCISVPVGAIPIEIRVLIAKAALMMLVNRVFRKEKLPGLVHAHFGEQGCIVADWAEKNAIPLVVTEHFSRMNQETVSAGLKRCSTYAYRHATRVITVSKKLQASILRHTGIESIVIPNVVDVETFCSGAPMAHERFRYVTTGRLIPQKRVDWVIEALGVIWKEVPSVELHILGDGSQKSELERLIVQLGLQDRVILHGMVTRQEMAEIYREADVFVLPSESETFGVAYIEAMAAGLPVISTRCGGPEEFINQRNGLLIDVDDKAHLERAMLDMHARYDCFDKKLIQDFACQTYSRRVIGTKLMELFREIIDDHARQ